MISKREPIPPSSAVKSAEQPGRMRRHRGAVAAGGWISDPPGSRTLLPEPAPEPTPRDRDGSPVPAPGTEGKVRRHDPRPRN